jgi:peptidoglycan/LPS O-acetylase OafA/YrhL
LAPAYLSHAEINGVPPVWTVGYLDQFAVGMLLAVALEVVPSASIASARRALLAGLCVAFGANFLYGSGAQSPYGNGSGVLFAPLMAFAFALLLASSLVSPRPTVLGRILTAKPILAAGTISYGIYLWHFLVIQRLQAWGLWSSAFVNLAFVAAITATAAIGSWFLIERPALRLKDVQLPRPIGRPVPATAPAAVSPT